MLNSRIYMFYNAIMGYQNRIALNIFCKALILQAKIQYTDSETSFLQSVHQRCSDVLKQDSLFKTKITVCSELDYINFCNSNESCFEQD